MSTPPIDGPPSWYNNAGKLDLFRKIMTHLKENPADRKTCLDPVKGRKMVESLTTMKIPDNAYIYFLPEGDNLASEPPSGANQPLNEGTVRERSTPAKGSARPPGVPLPGNIQYNAGSSLIITLPPESEMVDIPNNELLLGYACSYVIWAG